jgi:DNA-binding GntR family transcriptional regulator
LDWFSCRAYQIDEQKRMKERATQTVQGHTSEASSNALNKSCAQDVVDFVRNSIRQGALAPGQRLAEPDLMKRLSVSRGTVREALAQLRAEGLVEFERWRGAHVRILSRKKVIELNQIRAAIEGLGCRLAAQNLDDAGRLRLQALDVPYEVAANDYDRYNAEFHDLIVELSGNESLSAVISSTLLDTFRTQFQRLLTRPEVTKRSHEEHSNIIRAIGARDGETAERLMVLHIRSSTQEILKAPEHFFL